MMKKRIFASLLLCVFLLSSLTACNNASSESSSNASTASSGGTSQTAESSEPVEKTYDEKITISYATIQVRDGVDYNNEAYTKWWCDKFNIEWDIISLSFDNWAEKLRIWINSGDMPDLCTWNYVHSEALDYADQQLIRKLPDDWEAKWPSLSAAYRASGMAEMLEEQLGGTYILPRPIYFDNQPTEILTTHMPTMYMRKDWMEAVDFPVKDAYTASELMELARLIKEQDPGNVGQSLVPMALTPENMMYVFLFSNSSNCMTVSPRGDFYQAADGTYRWGPADEDTLTGLKLYQQAFREGLTQPEFYTYKSGDDIADFTTAGVAAMTAYSGVPKSFPYVGTTMKDNLGVDVNESVNFAIVLGEDGKYHGQEIPNYFAVQIMSPNMEDKKFERIMDLMDYSATKFGQDVVRMGIPEVDWKYGENGELVSLLEPGVECAQQNPSQYPIYNALTIASDNFSIVNPSIDQKWRDLTRKFYEDRIAYSDENTLTRLNWDIVFYTSRNMDKVSVDYKNEYAQIVVQDGDIEANWQAWINSKMPMIQPVLDELNGK
jgi:putative aldouronate transport system substrate-binding protein